MVELGLNKTELGHALGMGASFVSECQRIGNAPAWSELAVECLRRRNGLQHQDVVLLVRLTSKQRELVVPFLKALGVDYNAV